MWQRLLRQIIEPQSELDQLDHNLDWPLDVLQLEVELFEQELRWR